VKILLDADEEGMKALREAVFKAKPVVTFEAEWDRAGKFLESLERYTENFDDFCDCEAEKGIHKPDCMTLKFRADFDFVFEGKRK
jgi:hypothetical protein